MDLREFMGAVLFSTFSPHLVDGGRQQHTRRRFAAAGQGRNHEALFVNTAQQCSVQCDSFLLWNTRLFTG
jgi:hypothetical protein